MVGLRRRLLLVSELQQQCSGFKFPFPGKGSLKHEQLVKWSVTNSVNEQMQTEINSEHEVSDVLYQVQVKLRGAQNWDLNL